MNTRINPFGNLDDFVPTINPKPQIDQKTIDIVAEENGFPSRQPPKNVSSSDTLASGAKQQRRHRTGRNKQVNVKATANTVDHFNRLADELQMPLGEVLAKALNALELVRQP